MEEGQMFRIGRFDIVVGKPQSEFEFPPETPAVSRRHAAVEVIENQYYIIDLNSKAGTYINGERIPVNMRCLLSSGMRVSFGGEGAEYIFSK